MLSLIKSKVRELIIKAMWATDEWALPKEVRYLIDDGYFKQADVIIERQAKLYPHDPEITKARTLLSFCSRMHSEDVD